MGDEQISRYQNLLAHSFFGECEKVVVFLNPFGNPASTADPKIDDVPVLSMSWKQIANIINKCSGRGSKHDFRVQFSKHIRRNIIMDSEERRIVIDLLKEGDNESTVRKIIENYTDLGDDKYQESVYAVFVVFQCRSFQTL